MSTAVRRVMALGLSLLIAGMTEGAGPTVTPPSSAGRSGQTVDPEEFYTWPFGPADLMTSDIERWQSQIKHSVDKKERKMAAEYLAGYGRGYLASVITDVLEDASVGVWWRGVVYVFRYEFREAAPTLLKILHAPETPKDKRASVAAALLFFGDSKALEALSSVMPDLDADDLVVLADLLSNVHSKASVPALRLLAEHEDLGVRSYAFAGLVAVGQPGAKALARDHLQSILEKDVSLGSKARLALALARAGDVFGLESFRSCVEGIEKEREKTKGSDKEDPLTTLLNNSVFLSTPPLVGIWAEELARLPKRCMPRHMSLSSSEDVCQDI